MIKIMKVNTYYISVFLLTVSACILTYFILVKNKANQPSSNQETYDNTPMDINDKIEERYQMFREDVEKYRIGIPKSNYENLDRIHQAPSPYPSVPYKSTLPAQSNLFIDPKNMDKEVEYCDLLNRKYI